MIHDPPGSYIGDAIRDDPAGNVGEVAGFVGAIGINGGAIGVNS